MSKRDLKREKRFLQKQLFHERELHEDAKWQWLRDRRAEDRADRAKKDEELNNVRLQLRDQAGTFATKETVIALERAMDIKVDTAIARLNTQGTEGFRETEAERHGREEATKQLLENSRINNETLAMNRRWIIGLAVSTTLGLGATLATIVLHILS